MGRGASCVVTSDSHSVSMLLMWLPVVVLLGARACCVALPHVNYLLVAWLRLYCTEYISCPNWNCRVFSCGVYNNTLILHGTIFYVGSN